MLGVRFVKKNPQFLGYASTQGRGEGRLLDGLRRRVRGRGGERRVRRKVHPGGGMGQETGRRLFISGSGARGEKVNVARDVKYHLE